MDHTQQMQELFECAWRQGYGEMAKARPGVYLPYIPKGIYKILIDIGKTYSLNDVFGEENE